MPFAGKVDTLMLIDGGVAGLKSHGGEDHLELFGGESSVANRSFFSETFVEVGEGLSVTTG